MPTRMEIERRQQTVLALLERAERISAGDVRRELSLNADAANHLLRTMGEAGMLERHGKSAGTTWSLPAFDDPPEPPPLTAAQRRHVTLGQQRTAAPEPNGNGKPDVRERYVAFLVERKPERLLALLEQGTLEPTDQMLDAIEHAVL